LRIDIRIPIGLMFAALGLILAVYGWLSDPAIYERSLGLNVNRDWGMAMLLVGAMLLWFGRRGNASRSG